MTTSRLYQKKDPKYGFKHMTIIFRFKKFESKNLLIAGSYERDYNMLRDLLAQCFSFIRSMGSIETPVWYNVFIRLMSAILQSISFFQDSFF